MRPCDRTLVAASNVQKKQNGWRTFFYTASIGAFMLFCAWRWNTPEIFVLPSLLLLAYLLWKKSTAPHALIPRTPQTKQLTNAASAFSARLQSKKITNPPTPQASGSVTPTSLLKYRGIAGTPSTPNLTPRKSAASPNTDRFLSDETGLKKLIALNDKLEESRKLNASSPPAATPKYLSSYNYAPVSPSQVFSTYRASPIKFQTPSPKKHDEVLSHHHTEQTSHDFLEPESTDRLREATERLRVYLATRVIRPFIDAWERNEALLQQARSAPAPGTPAPSPSPFNPYALPTTTASMPLAAQDALLRERQMLERYLTVQGFEKRDYCLCRIKELAQDTALSKFRWNGGGMWRQREWCPEAEVPTDTAIVFSMLATFLDIIYETRMPGTPNFSQRHIAIFPEQPSSRKSPIVIYEARLNPPHFKIYDASDTRMFDIPFGRQNFFNSILLFLYLLKTRHANQIGALGDLSVGLVDTVLL